MSGSTTGASGSLQADDPARPTWSVTSFCASRFHNHCLEYSMTDVPLGVTCQKIRSLSGDAVYGYVVLTTNGQEIESVTSAPLTA